MLIRLGEYLDLSLGESPGNTAKRDRVILVAYGNDVVVAESSIDGKKLRPFLDETGYKNSPRAYFLLLPFGEYAANPFPEYAIYDTFPEPHPDSMHFDFYVRYVRQGDDIHREAIVTLCATLDDPIGWSVNVSINGVTFEADAIDYINRDIGRESVVEEFRTSRPPTNEDVVFSTNFLDFIIDCDNDPTISDGIESIMIATGFETKELLLQRLRHWKSSNTPIIDQCKMLSDMAMARGSLIQWLRK